MELFVDRVDSPLGVLVFACDDSSLCALEFAQHETRMLAWLRRRYGEIQLRTRPAVWLRASLRAYFAGEYGAINRIPIEPGGTPFQQEVWSALRRIPAGTTLTYGAMAGRLRRPAASRAVGLANARNPIAIVVPCHRMIGVHGALVGYGGGLARKRWLLAHEGATLPEPGSTPSLTMDLDQKGG
jgi:methylated-DNA-[protein]-cysteine S-methyltransferase